MRELLIKNKKHKISKLEFLFSKKVGEAIASYGLIEDNDKILIAISGGKDSMSMLDVLRRKQKSIPIKFDMVACYVDMGTGDSRRAALEKYLKDGGYNYIIEETSPWQSRPHPGAGPIGKSGNGAECFWCASNRRRKLFQVADRLSCNKIALGHHKDDIAETFLLNLFFHGEISTMLPKQEFFKGRLYIIRPLALCEEKFIVDYAEKLSLPRFNCECTNSGKTKRMFMKNIISMASEFSGDVRTNIFRSTKNIKLDYIIK